MKRLISVLVSAILAQATVWNMFYLRGEKWGRGDALADTYKESEFERDIIERE